VNSLRRLVHERIRKHEPGTIKQSQSCSIRRQTNQQHPSYVYHKVVQHIRRRQIVVPSQTSMLWNHFVWPGVRDTLTRFSPQIVLEIAQEENKLFPCQRQVIKHSLASLDHTGLANVRVSNKANHNSGLPCVTSTAIITGSGKRIDACVGHHLETRYSCRNSNKSLVRTKQQRTSPSSLRHSLSLSLSSSSLGLLSLPTASSIECFNSLNRSRAFASRRSSYDTLGAFGGRPPTRIQKH
jgi:hypothetical protein